MEAATGARWADLFAARYWAATTTLCLGVALFAFNIFLVATALPTAVREIGGVALLSWTVALFLVLAIVGGAAAARLKARFSARTVLIGAGLMFLAGTLVAASASSMAEILVGRALQGLGEGIVAALCYALIPELFPSRMIPKVFGAEAVVWAAAAFGGPLLAGAATDLVSWRAAFLINVPMIVIFLVLVLVVVPRQPPQAARTPMPLLRLAAVGAGIMMLALAAIAPTRLAAAALVAAAVATLVAVVVRDRMSASRLFPSDAFSLRTTVGVGLWVVLLMPFAQASAAVYLVLTLQSVWGFGATAAGLFYASLALAWSFTAIVVANFGRSETRALFIALGPVMLLSGLSFIVTGLAIDRPALLLVGQIASGSGFGFVWGFLSQAIMETAREGERDRATALVPTLQSAGYAIGAAFAGLVANNAGYVVDRPSAVRAAAMIVFVASAVASTAAIAAGLRLYARLRHATAIRRP
jgi:MFS family permease